LTFKSKSFITTNKKFHNLIFLSQKLNNYNKFNYHHLYNNKILDGTDTSRSSRSSSSSDDVINNNIVEKESTKNTISNFIINFLDKYIFTKKNKMINDHIINNEKDKLINDQKEEEEAKIAAASKEDNVMVLPELSSSVSLSSSLLSSSSSSL